MEFNLVQAVHTVFGPQGLGGILQSDYAIYGVILIAVYLLSFSVFSAALLRVRIFEGEGGVKLNPSGKMFAHAMTILVVIAFQASIHPTQMNLYEKLAALSIYAQIVIFLVLFMMTRKMITTSTQ